MAQHMAIFESLLESSQNDSKQNLKGQVSLFQMESGIMEEADAGIELPDIRDFDDRRKMTMEKEMLGVYITGHPLASYREIMEGLDIVSTDELKQQAESEGPGDIKDGDNVSVAGIITGIRTFTTKR